MSNTLSSLCMTMSTVVDDSEDMLRTEIEGNVYCELTVVDDELVLP